jgi:hypothetical protein
MNQHDAFRQIGYIQQALSQNKKPIGIFIAAGCPLSVRIEEDDDKGEKKNIPLIPDVAGLTWIIIEQLKSKDENPSDCDKLVAQMKVNGIESPNIEDILSEIRALKQVVGKATVREFTSETLAILDKEICKIISEKVDKELPDKESPYHNLAIWVRSIERDKPVHLFTTNYDLLLEQALEESACPYFDGFIGSRTAFFDLRTVEEENLLSSRWARLWKIHGSINWKLDKSGGVVRSDKMGKDDSYLIYPSHLKYDQSRKMPYLAMLDRLKDFTLAHSSVLFMSGYSFSDDHINDVLVQGLQSNPTAMTFAFLYGQLDDPKYVKAKQCAKMIPNLSLMAFDKAIIGRQEGVWTLADEGKINEIPAQAVVLCKKEEGEGTEKKVIKWFELRLGDFAKFGDFFREMSSTQTQDDEKVGK